MGRRTGAWCCALLVLLACSRKSELNRELITAVTRGDAIAVSGLLERGADADAREELNPGRSALAIAAEEDFVEIASLLIEGGAGVNARSNDGNTPLMYAAVEGNRDIALLLMERGAEINGVDTIGQTPLIKAATDGHDAVVTALLDKNAEPNTRDEGGYTAVMKAMINGHMEIARLLLQRGARLDERDRRAIEEAARLHAQGEEIDEIDER
jgi:ankyrin repeat protein